MNWRPRDFTWFKCVFLYYSMITPGLVPFWMLQILATFAYKYWPRSPCWNPELRGGSSPSTYCCRTCWACFATELLPPSHSCCCCLVLPRPRSLAPLLLSILAEASPEPRTRSPGSLPPAACCLDVKELLHVRSLSQALLTPALNSATLLLWRRPANTLLLEVLLQHHSIASQRKTAILPPWSLVAQP